MEKNVFEEKELKDLVDGILNISLGQGAFVDFYGLNKALLSNLCSNSSIIISINDKNSGSL